MRFAIILILGFLLSSEACSTKPETKIARVTRDCTGTYLQMDKGKDLYVCNREVLKDFKEQEKVNVAFDKIDKCASDTGMVCMMFHAHDFMVNISFVEKRD